MIDRYKQLLSLGIISNYLSDTEEPTFPCGMCRQTIIEVIFSYNLVLLSRK